MLTVLLSIIFSRALTFDTFSIAGLLFWMNYHPFISIILISNILIDCIVISMSIVILIVAGIAEIPELPYHICYPETETEIND